MKQITFEEITKSLDKLYTKTEDPYSQLQDQLSSEQPDIFNFLYQPDELNKIEQGVLFSVAQMGWYIIKNILKRDKPVSEDFLFEQMDRNEVNYDSNISGGNKKESEIRNELYFGNDQPYLMDFLVGLIFQHLPGSDEPVRGEILPNIIIDVKTVIDCLVLDEDKELAEICEKEYSDDTFESVRESVDGYIEQFKKTSLYMKLKPDEKNEVEFVISAFGELMYNFFLLVPINWNAMRAKECCIGIMPRKIVADKNFFNAVEPVLKAFMEFCGERGYVSDGKGIARRLQGITKSVIVNSDNPAGWGIGKTLLKGAESTGVDVSDRNKLDAYIDNYNADKRLSGGGISQVKKEKPGRNDPCHCGSGKKYKICCLDKDAGIAEFQASLPSQTELDRYTEFAKSWDLSNGPVPSFMQFKGKPNLATKSLTGISAEMDEMNFDSEKDIQTFLKSRMDSANNTPVDDFLGMTSSQVSFIAVSIFDECSGLVELKKDVPVKLLEELPVIKQCVYILKALAENEKGIKATAKGNFPRVLVQKFYELFVKEHDDFKRTPSKEDDVSEIQLIRFFLTDTGLMKKQHGWLSLTKKGRGVLEKYKPYELYRLIFIYLCDKYNWLYGTGYSELYGFIQEVVVFCLYMLKKKGDDFVSAAAYADIFKTAFPSLVEDMDSQYSFSLFESGFCYLFLENYALTLGLVEKRADGHRFEKDKIFFRTTALFKELFDWKI
jgi:hypothetical protein